MDIEPFLERYVEGYLFEDLRTMAKIRLPEGKAAGAVGYPMVMTALAGVELLGTLTSASTFNHNQGRDRFREFWTEFLYHDAPEKSVVGDAVYTLIRNGLAHTFMAKPTIEVSKGYDGMHLRPPNPGVAMRLDALKLHEDLERAYFKGVKPAMPGGLRDRMNTRLGELRGDYLTQVEGLRGVLGSIQIQSTDSGVPGSGVNSPAPFGPRLFIERFADTGRADNLRRTRG